MAESWDLQTWESTDLGGKEVICMREGANKDKERGGNPVRDRGDIFSPPLGTLTSLSNHDLPFPPKDCWHFPVTSPASIFSPFLLFCLN